MLRVSKTRDMLTWGSMLQVITEEVKKLAEQRINSRFIMYVPGVHNLALKNIQRGRRYGNSAESHQLKKARAYLGPTEKQNYGTVVERYLEDEQYQLRMHETRIHAIRHGRI